jgi:hypothetical protein
LFLRIVLLFIIFCNLKVYAECNFKSSDFINKLDNPKYIKEIQIKTPNIKKYNKNQFKTLVSNNNIIPKKLKIYHKANIKVLYTFGECNYKAKIRQHGDWNDHIYLDSGTPISSLRVNLKKGNIMNAVKFTLLIPSTRNDLNEVLGSLLLKDIGFIVPETFQVKTDINGVKNIMLFQEVVRKELLERNNRREGPILEGDESILWGDNYIISEYHPLSLSRVENKKWFLGGKYSAKITLEAFHKLQNAYLEHWHNTEDLKKILMNPNHESNELFSKYFFSLIALKGEHALFAHNRKFYYNSFTKEFEPIYYDGNLYLQKKTDIDDLIINKDKIFAAKKFYKLHSSEYKKNFSNLKNKNQIFKDFYDRTQVHKRIALKFFKKSMVNIKLNENIIQSLVNSTPNDNSWRRNIKKDHDRYLSKLTLLPELKQTIAIEILQDDKKFIALNTDNKKLFLTNKEMAEIISENKLNDLRYVYVPNYNYDDKSKNDLKKISNFSKGHLKYSKTLSVKIDYNSKIINFKQTKPDDWVLFVNTDMSQWKIIFEGVKSTTKNVKIERINSHGLTGCLNFYQSIFFNNIIKINNGQCEDSLNIISSKGMIAETHITNAFSDGLDVDFSNIKFGSVSITKSGNDCMDVSSGNYNIMKIDVKKCGDKGVSVGEKSNMTIQVLNVEEALIGLSSKDSSSTIVKSNKQKNVKNCFEVKKKKQEFDGSKLELVSLNCKKNIVDINSSIVVGGL